jgi:competence protein ComEA
MFATAKLLGRNGPSAWQVRVLAALGALVVAAGGVVGWAALRPPPTASRAVPFGGLTALDPGAPALVLVFVSGAVAHPGLYHLSPGARIADALAAAGGLTPDADPGRLPDLASTVHDGHQVNVPFRRTTSTGGRVLADRLDINTATIDELRAVPGMPLGVPEAIVGYRDQFGPFRAMSDLRLMLGLDGPTVTGLRLYLRVIPVTP